MGGGHGHGVEVPSLPLPIRRVLSAVVAALGALTLLGLLVWWPRGDAPDLNPPGVRLQYVDATVSLVTDDVCDGVETAAPTDCQVVTATVTSGPDEGADAVFVVFATDFSAPALEEGDRIVLLDNPDAPAEFRYSFAEYQRATPMIALGVLFAVSVAVFGRWRGFFAMAGLVVSGVVLLTFLLPSLLRDNPAVPVALTGASVIAFAVLYLAHGVNARTTVALLGTMASLLAITVIAAVMVGAARLTGLADAEAQVLRVSAGSLDLQGLLLAGIVIGALGVLDDVTVTQVSAVAELRRADPAMSARDLYAAGVSIGRDHVASTVNTLFLAYAGASLPLLLLYFQGGQPLGRITTQEIVAVEVVRTLAGSIGLVLSVPMTTALAVLVLTGRFPGMTTSSTRVED